MCKKQPKINVYSECHFIHFPDIWNSACYINSLLWKFVTMGKLTQGKFPLFTNCQNLLFCSFSEYWLCNKVLSNVGKVCCLEFSFAFCCWTDIWEVLIFTRKCHIVQFMCKLGGYCRPMLCSVGSTHEGWFPVFLTVLIHLAPVCGWGRWLQGGNDQPGGPRCHRTDPTGQGGHRMEVRGSGCWYHNQDFASST